MKELEKYYRVLGLEPGASLEEVNQAYKDLVFVWHPDRFPKENQRLVSKAQEKIKEINLAREKLRALGSKAPTPKRQRSPASTTARHSPKPPPSSPDRPQGDRADSRTHHRAKQPHNPDWSGADFRRANLREKDLSGRQLSHANFKHANLQDAFLHKTNLAGANLEHANLFRANLLQANLAGANLQHANLIGADLSGADLSRADLRGAKIGTADRILVKLIGAKLTHAILPDGRIHQ